MRVPIAFVDANVLFSKTLRDSLFLLRRQCEGMFCLFSSRDSVTEAMYHLRRRPRADGGQIARIEKHLYAVLDDVVEDFPGNVSFPGLDEHDAHIHVAAIAAGASYLITNDAGFGSIQPDHLRYEVHTTDSFFMLVAENKPSAVDAVIIEQLRYYEGVEGAERLDQMLERNGSRSFAECVRSQIRGIARAEGSHGVAELIRKQWG